MSLRASALLALGACACGETTLPPDDHPQSKDDIVAGIPATDADHGREALRWCAPFPDLAGCEPRFVITIHQEEDPGRWPVASRFTLYACDGGRYLRRVGIDLGRSDSGWFEAPRWFRHDVVDSDRGVQFVAVARGVDGTGAFHDEHVWSIDHRGVVTPVDFVPAPKSYTPALAAGEQICKGEGDHFADGLLTFVFEIWKPGDGNCCPTAGRVTGTYRVLAFAQPARSFGEADPPRRYRIEMASSQRAAIPERR